MIRLLKYTVALAAAAACMLAAGCAKHRIIPDKTLAAIFHDAFLTNAYADNRRFAMDSLDLYQPIFQKYGYTAEDVQYTIGNFSKRKSARLGDVVEEAIKVLEAEGKVLEYEGAILDTVDNIARRRFTRTVYRDSLLRISRLKDTSRLMLVIDDIRAGDYNISFDYRIDSLDNNTGHRTSFDFERSDSTRFGHVQQSLRRTSATETFTRRLTADTSARRLIINLMEFREPVRKGTVRHTGATFWNIKVVHTPLTSDAVESLFAEQLPLRVFAEEFFGPWLGVDGTDEKAEETDEPTEATEVIEE